MKRSYQLARMPYADMGQPHHIGHLHLHFFHSHSSRAFFPSFCFLHCELIL